MARCIIQLRTGVACGGKNSGDCLVVKRKAVSLQRLKEAGVAKLVDALDLGSSAVRRGGSSPFART